MGKPELQSLFEKVADQYEGTVEQKHVTDEYVDLQFLKDSNDGPVEVGHVRLSIVHVDVDPVGDNDPAGKCRDMVRIVDHYGGPEIIVSNVVSAIIAISTN